MKVLFDTSVLIEQERGRWDAVSFNGQIVGEHEVAISAITVSEILVGFSAWFQGSVSGLGGYSWMLSAPVMWSCPSGLRRRLPMPDSGLIYPQRGSWWVRTTCP